MINNKFVPLVDIPEDQNYESYVYLVVFDHDKPMKYYFGSKDGLFDGTYEGSPTAHEKEYFQDLRKF